MKKGSIKYLENEILRLSLNYPNFHKKRIEKLKKKLKTLKKQWKI